MKIFGIIWAIVALVACWLIYKLFIFKDENEKNQDVLDLQLTLQATEMSAWIGWALNNHQGVLPSQLSNQEIIELTEKIENCRGIIYDNEDQCIGLFESIKTGSDWYRVKNMFQFSYNASIYAWLCEFMPIEKVLVIYNHLKKLA